MRYVIIPLIIICYLYWSYKSIYNIIDYYKNPYLDVNNVKELTCAWVVTHLCILSGIILCFIIKYW